MKVFISWSGDRSKTLAEELRDWLPTIVQSLEPFISTQDVPLGGRGLNVLASELQDCSFGILCLTKENKQGPWIHFEAGALSKVIDTSRVVPLLLDLKVSDLTGPLTQFQAVSIGDRDGVFSLIRALAESSVPPVAEARLRRLFEAFWPDLEEKVSQLKEAGGIELSQEVRSEREILEEILLLSRSTERQMARTIPQEKLRSPKEDVAAALTDALHRIGVVGSQYWTTDKGIRYRIIRTSAEGVNQDEAIAVIREYTNRYGLSIIVDGGPFEEEITLTPDPPSL
jgi:hypothetical protein